MAGYNFAQNIIGLKKGSGDIRELELEVAQLSASVLEIGEKVENATTYSTDEKIVGTYLGEILYGRMFEFNSDFNVPNDSYATTNISDVSYNQLVDCIGIYSQNGAMYALFGYFDNGVLKIQTPRNSYPDTIDKIYIKYTKTTA